MWYVIIAVISSFITFVVERLLRRRKMKIAEETYEKMIERAKSEAKKYKETAILELKAEWSKKQNEFEAEMSRRRKEIEQREKNIEEREANVDRKADIISRKEADISRKEVAVMELEKLVKEKEEKLAKLLEEENEKLLKISRLNEEEARKILLGNLEEKIKNEMQEYINKEWEKMKAKVEMDAKKILATAIAQSAISHVTETSTVTVNLPNDGFKGRLIGREGRNIRAFETITGVNLIIDETPNCVFLSSLDPVKKEIARIALERLLVDGRINPTTIEENVNKVRKEFLGMVEKIGNDTAMELKVAGLHKELIKLLGQLKFRTSYGQNVLEHSKEVAILAKKMAEEIGLDANLALRAGLLHDIGKAAPPEYEGTHQKIGAQLARMYGEDEIIVNAIAAHHRDAEAISPIAALVEAADGISGGRPGARRETFEAYVERIEKLESLASSFDSVEKAYALQAGREIRVIVKPDKVSDKDLTLLANEIAKKIESEMKYPGEINVTVIREVRGYSKAK